MNILLLSVGTRNKIVSYFKESLDNGKIYAADSSKLAPALYEADGYFIIPRLDEANYLETVFDICERYEIKGILSLIDPELNILAKHAESFKKIGTFPIVPSYEVTARFFDKYKTYEFLRDNGFDTIRTYKNMQDFKTDYQKQFISFPVFIKPNTGSASKEIHLADDYRLLELYAEKHKDIIIQENMTGTEYGIDVYRDFITGEITQLFIKEKLKMRAGETDKSVSIHNKNIHNLITEFVYRSDLYGVLDIDVFESQGKYLISEVNPRFGGGYPHAHASGFDFPKAILRNIENRISQKIVQYQEQTFMMKYQEIILKKA